MRPSKDEYFSRVALLVANRSTCYRRHVGCVLVNSRGHVLATGYNGVAAGMPHSNEPTDFYLDGAPRVYGDLCKGAKSPSGQDLDKCEAIHAEQNALLQCKDVWEIDVCYTTAAPCIHCVKLLMNTSCNHIVYTEEYTHTGSGELWTRDSQRIWRRHTLI